MLRLLPFVVLAAALAAPAAGQRTRYGQDRPEPAQSLTARYTYIDFRYNGDEPLPLTFDYAGPVYGVAFTRPGFAASIAFGGGAPASTAGDPRDLQVIDADLFTWAEMVRIATVRSAGRLYVPLALHSNYRRVSREDEGEEDAFTDAFSVTVFGLGTGLAGDATIGRRVHVEARALPVIGLAARTVGDATGSARLFDADLQVHVSGLAGRFGLTLGYGFRAQDWNVDFSGVAGLQDGFFHYGGHHHTLRAGVNW